jgi:Flp pilus assembly protein TadD
MGALASAIAIAPERPTPWVNLGVLRESVGDLQGAIEATRRAVELGPERPTGWANLARLQLRVGDTAGARAVLETAERLGIRDPRLRALRGRLSAP